MVYGCWLHSKLTAKERLADKQVGKQEFLKLKTPQFIPDKDC